MLSGKSKVFCGADLILPDIIAVGKSREILVLGVRKQRTLGPFAERPCRQVS